MTHDNAKICSVLRNIQDVAIIVQILTFRKDKTITHGPNVILIFNVGLVYMQTNYNKVEMCWWKSDKKINSKCKHTREKTKRLRRKMEVRETTFNYFAQPQHRDLNFFIRWWWPYKIYCCTWFQNVLWVYGMAWMSVRLPSLKFCPSPTLQHIITEYTEMPQSWTTDGFF